MVWKKPLTICIVGGFLFAKYVTSVIPKREKKDDMRAAFPQDGAPDDIESHRLKV